MSKREEHGMSGTPEYKIWCGIKKRCNNSNFVFYKNYGGRGIKVAQEWNDSFLSFYNYIGQKPENTEIDRIDNDKGYEPGNVRWVTKEVNMKNRRKKVTLIYKGKETSIEEYCKAENLKYTTAWNRIKTRTHLIDGISKTISAENNRKRKLTTQQVSEIMTLTERTDVLSERYGVAKSLIIAIRNGTSNRVKRIKLGLP